MPESATRAPKKRPLDDETSAALTLFNTYLIADREQQAQERALKKAQKAKDEAAAAVRKLNDRKAPTSEMAEAEARYREAAEALQRLRDGDTEASEETQDTAGENADETSVGVEASVGDEDLAGDEPAGVAG